MNFMRVAIGCDHAGYELKEEIKRVLNSKHVACEDVGTYSTESCDYPDYVYKAAQAVVSGTCDKAIFVCKTAAGTSMAANKIRGIRACQVFGVEAAKLSREHNDANFLALGDIQDHALVVEIVEAWLGTDFSNEERHVRRLAKLKRIEDGTYERH